MKKLGFLLFALMILAGCQKNSTQTGTAENAAASAEPVAVDAAEAATSRPSRLYVPSKNVPSHHQATGFDSVL